MEMTLQEIAAATGGRILRGDPALAVDGVCTDTREMFDGALFFALRGPNFDAHEFLPKARRLGAAAAVVHTETAHREVAELPIVRVDDTTRALGDLARWHRDRCSATTVIGITGSNGKTTVKEMLYHILNGVVRSIRTLDNQNNHIGVPLTLFRMQPQDVYAVVEMGTNSTGEIKRLCEIAAPDIGLITCIAASHLEGLGSVEGVAREKAPVLIQTARRGGGFYHADDFWSRRIGKDLKGKVQSFGIDNKADVRATGLRSDADGISFKVIGGRRLSIPILGTHNVRNALAAVAVARKLGIDWDTIQRRLNTFRLPDHRMQVRQVGGVTIIDDAYNANPASMEAAAETLARMKCRGRKLFVAGDMLELGEDSIELHRTLGAALAGFGFDGLFGTGPNTMHVLAAAGRAGMPEHGLAFQKTRQDLARILTDLLEPGDTVLFKASRGMALEKVAEQVAEELAEGPRKKPERTPAPIRRETQTIRNKHPHSTVGRSVG